MATMTVEQKIIEQYDCSVADLLQTFADEGLTSKQVAMKLECGVSNVRRIARKYQIRFNQPTQQSQLLQNEEFRSEKLNPLNFLSRQWNALSAGQAQTAH